jgi:hypothetical protein
VTRAFLWRHSQVEESLDGNHLLLYHAVTVQRPNTEHLQSQNVPEKKCEKDWVDFGSAQDAKGGCCADYYGADEVHSYAVPFPASTTHVVGECILVYQLSISLFKGFAHTVCSNNRRARLGFLQQ